MKSIYLTILVLLITSSVFAHKIKHRHHSSSQSRMRLKQEAPPTVAFEGWLRIATETLLDTARYPDIPSKKQGKPAFGVKIFGDKPTDEAQKVPGENYEGVFRKNTQWLEDGSSSVPAIDAFYFRISGHNLYYTETGEDTVVLGAISVHNIKSTAGGPANCFVVVDDESDNWTLCTVDGAATSEWICPISEALGLPCPEEGEGGEEENIKKVLVTQPLLIVPLPSPDCARDWNYNFHGANWVCKCNEGLEQSPIDLPSHACMSEVKVNAEFDYKTVHHDQVKVVYHNNILRILTKSSSVSMGKLTDVDGTEYEVSEVLIHTPAEHTIMGRKFDVEVQVVHKAIKGAFKQKAVLAILYEKRPGAIVQAFEEMDILNLPNPLFNDQPSIVAKDFHVAKFFYNDDQYLSPPPFDYFKYRGSFTFPPCEEDVIWFVLSDVVPIGTTAYTFLRDVPNPPKTKALTKCAGEKAGAVTYADNYDGTNREVQPLRNREIFWFDRTKGCNPYSPKAKPPAGHYEKLEQKAMKYFYVDGDRPSGIPGALVISSQEADGKVPPPRGTGDRFGLHSN